MRWLKLALLSFVLFAVTVSAQDDNWCVGVDCACVNVDALMIRSQASEYSRALGTLHEGQCVYAMEVLASRSGFDWGDTTWSQAEGAYVHRQSAYPYWIRFWVMYEGRVINGWVAADFVEIDQCAEAVIEYTGYECHVG